MSIAGLSNLTATIKEERIGEERSLDFIQKRPQSQSLISSHNLPTTVDNASDPFIYNPVCRKFAAT